MKHKYDERYGGPYDRGSADSYYRRSPSPHYYVGNTYSSKRIDRDRMTEDEVAAYYAGYDENEEYGEHKDWG